LPFRLEGLKWGGDPKEKSKHDINIVAERKGKPKGLTQVSHWLCCCLFIFTPPTLLLDKVLHDVGLWEQGRFRNREQMENELLLKVPEFRGKDANMIKELLDAKGDIYVLLPKFHPG
jgi:hypothetical protein